MGNTNRISGLENGALNSGAIVNMISNDDNIDMGSAVDLLPSIPANEIQPRVDESTIAGQAAIYGIAVGGDADGVYGDGSASTSDLTRAVTKSGQTVRVLTRGKCPARVEGNVGIGDKLVSSLTNPGVLRLGTMGANVIGISLGIVGAGDLDMIIIEVTKEGILA